MPTVTKDSFIAYLRSRWTPAGYDLSDAQDAPYKEQVKHMADGFSFGLTLSHDDASAGHKARVGVWFRPAPKGGIADLAALRTHYQVKLQQQGRGCRIHNCATELGSFFLFWETTSQLPESVVMPWVEMVEELSGLCFDSDALDAYLNEAG